MPRGRPRKQKAEEVEKTDPELQKAISTDDHPVIDIKPTRKKTVTQVAKWTEEEAIEPDEETEEEGLLDEFQEEEESQGVFEDFLQPGADGNFIKVWKLPSWKKDQRTGLRNTNRQFCDDLPVTPDYMQIIKSTWGAGVYQLELRDERNRIVKNSRRMTIEIAAPNMPQIQQVQTLPNGQQIPIVIEQQAQQPHQQTDPLKQLRQAFSIVREFRDELGINDQTQANNQPQVAPVSPKVAALELITENPDVMEKIGKGLTSLISGGRNDHEVSWADVGMKLVETGQAPQMAANIIREFMAPFASLWGNNGQAQMAPATPPQSAGFDNRGAQLGQDAPPQEVTQGLQGVQPGNGEVDRNSTDRAGQRATPEIQALTMLLEHCQRQIPAKVAAERLLAFERQIEAQAPHLSIAGYIDILVELEPDAAFGFVNHVVPGSEAVTSLPHAKEWLIELQKSLKTETGGSETDET